MTTPIFLLQLGVGGVGRALVEQVLATRAAQVRYGLELRFAALLDSSGALAAQTGLTDEAVQAASVFKAAGGQLATYVGGEAGVNPLALAEKPALPRTIIVDTTAAAPAAVLPAFERVLAQGGGVVLANKKPLTDSWAQWETLTRDGRTGYEATVGAGLPVISSLRALLDTGDEVTKIEGAFSGTLGFLMSELQDEVPFASAVRDAKARGWTEPDPRDDLSGTDVARKALILARTLGYRVEGSEVEVTALYPPGWADLSLDEFMARLDELNPVQAGRRDVVHGGGRRLRYAATVTNKELRVGPVAVAPDSPLGVLRGPDNLVAFHTTRYASRPLVVQGAGAGVQVTASALLGDILRIGQQLNQG